MTLVIAATGRESIWIATDRRLSASGKAICDDAVKIMRLERKDEVALLGYSGLGRTSDGTQPSDWMNAVLRDRNEPLVQSLEILGGAIDRQIPKYMLRVPGVGDAAHVVLAPALIGKHERWLFDATFYRKNTVCREMNEAEAIKVSLHQLLLCRISAGADLCGVLIQRK